MVGGVKDKIIHLFQTKDYSKAIRVNKMCGGGRKPRKLKIKKTIRKHHN